MTVAAQGKWLRPHGEFFYWRDDVIDREGLCHQDDWPVEWEQQECELSLLVPTAQTIECWVTIPQGIKLDIEGISYLAEDQIATELSALHFALGLRMDDRQQLFAVPHSFLSDWQEVVRSRGSLVRSIYTEAEFLSRDGEMFAAIDLLLRRNDVTLCLGSSSYQQLVAADALPAAKEVLVCDYYEGELPPVDEVINVDYWSRCNRLKTNLAIGAYAPPIAIRKYWRKYRLVASAVLALLTIEAISYGLGVWQLQREQDALEDAQLAVFREISPSGRVVNAYSQMLALATTDNRVTVAAMYALFTDLSTVLDRHSDVSFQRVDIRAGSAAVEIVLEAENFASLDRFKAAVEATSTRVDVQSSQSRSGITTARIRVERS